MNALTPEQTALIENFHLASGTHARFKEGACALELVSYLAGEPWSDHPECACPTLSAFLRAWNDGLPDDERDALLKPFLPRLIGTRGDAALAERRSLMAADWLVRIHAPAWLRLAKLDAQAQALSGLPEITGMAQIPSIRRPTEAAKRDAAARHADWDAAGAVAWDATWAAAGAAAAGAAAAGAAAWAWDAAGAVAWDAAGAAAWDAAWAAAWAAAWDAAGAAAWAAAGAAAAGAAAWAWDAAGAVAWDAAGAVAWDAAGAAAWAAAGAAAGAALAPTRAALQASAVQLVERMLSCQ